MKGILFCLITSAIKWEVAQSAEQAPVKRTVVGSIPTFPSINLNQLKEFVKGIPTQMLQFGL